MFNLKAEFYLKIIFLFSFIALISAFFIEYILGHQPCNLCLIERIPYVLSIILIVFNYIFKNNKTIFVKIIYVVFHFFIIFYKEIIYDIYTMITHLNNILFA